MNSAAPSPTSEELAAAAAALRRGEVVAFPTETVYGLGASALDALAVARVFELKARPRFDPLIVHIADHEQLTPLVTEVPPLAAELMRRFWPGPLTLVLPKSKLVPDIVTADLPTVAVRWPAHPVAARLIQLAGRPIAAPSANRFGKISPTTAAHVREQFGAAVPLVLDAGPCAIGVESTVVAVQGDECELLRSGGVTFEELSAVCSVRLETAARARPAAPGQLLQHYAPETRLEIHDELTPPEAGQRVGLLAWRDPPSLRGWAAVEILSPTGDLREAAANLFAAMRRLDALSLDRIVALRVPETGLGRAIMDRLVRAAAREPDPAGPA